MRFVSKSANLMLVLKQGFPGNHLTGTAPVSGVYVKFQNGVVDVKEDSLIELMQKHPGFNVDYIAVDEGDSDPFEYLRDETEPAHVLTEIKYGHVEKSVGNKKPVKVSPELKAYIQNEAKKLAAAMLPEMVKEVISQAKELSNSPDRAIDNEESFDEDGSSEDYSELEPSTEETVVIKKSTGRPARKNSGAAVE